MRISQHAEGAAGREQFSMGQHAQRGAGREKFNICQQTEVQDHLPEWPPSLATTFWQTFLKPLAMFLATCCALLDLSTARARLR